MTKSASFLLAAAALVVGALIGVFVCRGEEKTETPTYRGSGDGVKPSDLMGGGNQSWPNVDCGGGTAAQMLDEIQALSEQAFETRSDQINLSPVAAAKVKSLLDQEGRDDLSLRISVQPGGCSGLRYQLFFDERSLDGDVVTDFDGVAVVVDRMSVPYLNGAVIDFVDTIEKQGFTIDNPNATGSCACGDSFH